MHSLIRKGDPVTAVVALLVLMFLALTAIYIVWQSTCGMGARC
jgi:hypothetical protein